ncbi:MAG TPA: TonB-dependent receptor plug domain-containing protein, partial [Marinagarivorans sp.]
MKNVKHKPSFQISILSLAIASAMVGAQEPVQDSEPALEEVVITGYRGSLQSSAEAKRDSTGFSDTVFADDIGKMPSQNLAESLARIPGVLINREVTGEGKQISVRGLGPSFTAVTLNRNAISVASTGSLGAGNRNREVDLDLFPTELFGALSVAKTPMAHQMEGGISGYVDMRTLRPSDMGEGANFRVGLEGAYNDMSENVNPRGTFTASFSNDTFGALVSVVNRKNETRVDGFEQDANYQRGCAAEWFTNAEDERAVGCVQGNPAGHWINFHYTDIASADYAASHAGVNVGDTIDIEAVSGLSYDELDDFGMGRIMRMMTTSGTNENLAALVSLEYTPSEDLSFALDVIRSEADRDFLRTEAMLIYRNNFLGNDLATIPSDIELIDRGAGQRLVSGTFYGARPFIGDRAYEEELEF